MREIKFRAWDNVLKEFGPDNAFVGFSFFGEVLTFDMIGMRISETMDKRPHLGGAALMGTNDFVVEQFTGLKDKNGREIYEGDVVRQDTSFEWFGKVVWDGPCPGLIGVNGSSGWDALMGVEEPMVVIGNIHENPELLK
jgi:uncharacterized phage protein (TIGR01671 family)